MIGRNAAAVAVVALGCIVLAPPLGIDSRLSNLESALLVLAGALVVAFLGSGRSVAPVQIPVLALVLLALMATSAIWSASGWVTMRDVIAFGAIALAAVLLATAVGLRVILVGVGASGLVLLVWGLMLILIAPEQAFTTVGAFVGPYGNRNGYAYALLTGAIAWMTLTASLTWLSQSLRVLSVAALGTGVYFTTSRTALIVLLGAAAAVLMLRIVPRSRTLGIVFGGACIAGVSILALNFGWILDVFNKGDTINGRVPIWETLWPLIGDRPFNGYGWSMAWPVGAEPSISVSEALNGVVVFHAHNETLNWLITLGAPGLALVIAIYATIVWASVHLLIAREPSHRAIGLWLLVFSLVGLARGISDISETLPQGWFLLMLMLAFATGHLMEVVPRGGRFLAFPPSPPASSARRRAGVHW